MKDDNPDKEKLRDNGYSLADNGDNGVGMVDMKAWKWLYEKSGSYSGST